MGGTVLPSVPIQLEDAPPRPRLFVRASPSEPPRPSLSVRASPSEPLRPHLLALNPLRLRLPVQASPSKPLRSRLPVRPSPSAPPRHSSCPRLIVRTLPFERGMSREQVSGLRNWIRGARLAAECGGCGC
ncbi:unnamed protein product [Closterium sp. NIES-54]